MRTNRFYCPDLNSSDVFELPESVFRHAIQVLRLKAGSEIELFDGQGWVYEANILSVERRRATAKITQKSEHSTESPLQLTLIQGISKGERMDFAIQKAVELGVSQIIPVQTARCNVNLNAERGDKRWMHWQGVVISACEQSGRNYLPTLQDVMSFEHALAMTQDACKLVLDPMATQSINALPISTQATLLIGPEGGLSEDEIGKAVDAGFTAVRFGPRILRTETAALAAIAILQAKWGDIG